MVVFALCHRLWRGPASAGGAHPNVMRYCVYVLQSESRFRYYIGSCANIDERLARHNRGSVRATKYGIPWRVVYVEEFSTRQDAYKREMAIKKYKGGGAFKRLLREG